MRIFDNEQSYRDYNALHYSLLSAHLSEEIGKDKSNAGMSIGSTLDLLVLSPHLFDSKVVLLDSVPGEKTHIYQFAKLAATGKNKEDVFKHLGIKSPKTLDSFLLSYNKKEGNKLEEAFRENKYIIDLESNIALSSMKSKLKSHFSTADYFDCSEESIIKRSQVGLAVEQSELPWDLNLKANIKILIDLLHIDHENKVICPVDLKYSGQPLKEFKKLYRYRYNYWVQSALYYYVICFFLQYSEEFHQRFGVDATYTVDGFRFAVVNENEAPRVYKVESEKLEVLFGGGIYDNVEYRGVLSLAQDYLYCKEKGMFNYPKEALDSGEIIL